jgi:hypothetical protein
MAVGRHPPRHNRLTRRRGAEKTRQSNPQPTGDPQKTHPIRANRATDALVLATATAQSPSGRERPNPSYEKCGLTSGGARPNERRYYVSYAWADENDPKREEQVDMLCDEAGKRGVSILRDKTTLSHGDLISEFMRRIGEGDRVFIFLSEKYLRSPYCMFEMFEMWRNSKQNKAEFLRRVRVFTIDGAKIGKPREWLAYTKFWKQEREELRNDIDAVGWADAGEEVIKRYRHMDTFTGNISDVLALFADVVQPRKIEDFIEYGFKDESPGTTTA